MERICTPCCLSPGRSRAVVRVYVLCVLLSCLSAVAWGADANWSSTNGGDFSDSANWDGYVVPGTDDNAIFDLDSEEAIDVYLSQSVTNTDLEIRTDNITLDLSGYTYTLSGVMRTGSGSDDIGVLELVDGTLDVTGRCDIGYASGSEGFVTVGPAVDWATDDNIWVGLNGAGTLSIEGGEVTAEYVFIGTAADGTVDVSGTNGQLTATSLYAGNSTNCSLDITDGANVTVTSTLFAGKNGGGAADVTVDGASSTWRIEGPSYLGWKGSADIEVTDGGSLESVRDATLAMYDIASASVVVSGTGSDWTISGNLTCGHTGQGSITVVNGGTMTTEGSGSVGTASVTGVGAVIVTGSGSLWDAQAVNIGGATSSNGNGSVAIADSGVLSAANNIQVRLQGALALDSGVVEIASAKELENLGVLSGDGIVRRSGTSGTISVDNQALMMVGTDGTTGTVYIEDGTFGCTSTSTLSMDLGSATDYDYDQVICADGAVTLDGEVVVKLTEDHVLHDSDTFDLVIGTTVTTGTNFILTDSLSDPWSVASCTVVTLTSGPYSGKQALRVALNKGALQIEDLGNIYSSCAIKEAMIFKDADEHLHIAVTYRPAGSGQQMVHIDIENEESYLIDMPGVNQYNWHGLYHAGENALFIGDNYYVRYDLSTHTASVVDTTAPNNMLADTSGLYKQVENESGVVFIGECSLGYLESYDPGSDTWTNYGIVDSGDSSRYVYTIGAEKQWVYCGMGKNPWYVVVYDVVNNSQTAYFKDAGFTNSTIRRHKTTGKWYRGLNHRFEDGVLYDDLVSVDDLIPAYMTGTVCRDAVNFPEAYSYEVNLDDALPDQTNSYTATIGYRELGTGEWTYAQESGMSANPVEIKRMSRAPDGTVYALPGVYQPVLTYDWTANAAAKVGPLSQISVYGHFFASSGKQYVSGYPTKFAEYDPSEEWTLMPSSSDTSTTNPRLISGVGNAQYIYYMAEDANGIIYPAGNKSARDGSGGCVGWYDPSSGESGYKNDEVFHLYACNDLIAVNGGAKMVVSGTALDGVSDGKLIGLSYDSNQDTVVVSWTYEPVAGRTGCGKIVEVADNVICGFYNSQVYRFNFNTGQREYLEDLPGNEAWGTRINSTDKRVFLGPGGYIWLLIEDTTALWTKLYRVDPSDGSAEDMSGNLGYRRSRPFLFIGDDIYMFGAGLKNLERIVDVVP